MSISGALPALGGMVAVFLPTLPRARTTTAPYRATMLRDGIVLLRLRIYRRIVVAAALLRTTHSQ
jgi:hypothetical protein